MNHLTEEELIAHAYSEDGKDAAQQHLGACGECAKAYTALRIDLALVSRDLAGELSECGIDRDYRKGSKPSDHAPLLVAVGGEAAEAWIPVRRPSQRR